MLAFTCNDKTLEKAFSIAVSDALGNVKPYAAGLITEKKPCIIAGAGYDTPWTRDTSINTANAFAFLSPEITKNTILSVLREGENGVIIDGQYWDAIILTLGMMRYMEVTGDWDFLPTALTAAENYMKKMEADEFDPEDGLFRGAAVYGDGVAAYPDQYANHWDSGIFQWVRNPKNQKRRAPKGFGVPMKALSTNCVYYEAYKVLAAMKKKSGKPYEEDLQKAEALKKAINEGFYNEMHGTYDYLKDECQSQEALGISFALLFDVVDDDRAQEVLEKVYVAPHGIPCVYPNFGRYERLGNEGRHAGTVWPHAQGYFARAAFKYGRTDLFEGELNRLAEKAVRDGQFYEIYHSKTGEIYGGLQEGHRGKGDFGIRLWDSRSHQTWSATAYLSLIFYVMLGIRVEEGNVTFSPYLPTGVDNFTLTDLKIGNTTFNVAVTRGKKTVKSFDTTKTETVTLSLQAD